MDTINTSANDNCNDTTPRNHVHTLEIIAFSSIDGFIYAINPGPNAASDAPHLHALTMLLSEVLCTDGSGLVVVHVMPNYNMELSVTPSYTNMECTNALTSKIKQDGLGFIIQTLTQQYKLSLVSDSATGEISAHLVSVGFDNPRDIDRGDVTTVLHVNKTFINTQLNAFFNNYVV